MKWRTKLGREAAGVEELAQRLVLSRGIQGRNARIPAGFLPDRPDPSRPASSARARRWNRGISAASASGLGDASEDARANRPRAPSAPAYSTPVLGVADRQRHLRGLGRDAELGEETQQGGVGLAVVDDEAGVDGQLAVGGRDPVRVGVAAEAVVGLVERDVGGA